MSCDLRIVMGIWVTLLGRPAKNIENILEEIYGSVENAWFSYDENFEKTEDTENSLCIRVNDAALREKAIEIYEECEKEKINIIFAKDALYPNNLREVGGHPYLLYYKGKLPSEIGISEDMLISVVGARRCTSYGRVNSYRFSKSLAECGFGIVSGMARGIDAEAHKGAIFANGYTIAVLGSGLSNIYPKEHRKLFEEISEVGCVVSEFSPKTPPLKSNFPARNRIISGLSKGLIVVEASEKSGAMITVNFALEEGRTVFAIPGNINSEKSYGCNMLIKQGAVCVTSYADILDEYNIVCDSPKMLDGWIRGLEGGEAAVVNAVLSGHNTVNEICRQTERCTGNVLSALTMLEFKGILTKGLDGAYYIKK